VSWCCILIRPPPSELEEGPSVRISIRAMVARKLANLPFLLDIGLPIEGARVRRFLNAVSLRVDLITVPFVTTYSEHGIHISWLYRRVRSILRARFAANGSRQQTSPLFLPAAHAMLACDTIVLMSITSCRLRRCLA